MNRRSEDVLHGLRESQPSLNKTMAEPLAAGVTGLSPGGDASHNALQRVGQMRVEKSSGGWRRWRTVVSQTPSRARDCRFVLSQVDTWFTRHGDLVITTHLHGGFEVWLVYVALALSPHFFSLALKRQSRPASLGLQLQRLIFEPDSPAIRKPFQGFY